MKKGIKTIVATAGITAAIMYIIGKNNYKVAEKAKEFADSKKELYDQLKESFKEEKAIFEKNLKEISEENEKLIKEKAAKENIFEETVAKFEAEQRDKEKRFAEEREAMVKAKDEVIAAQSANFEAEKQAISEEAAMNVERLKASYEQELEKLKAQYDENLKELEYSREQNEKMREMAENFEKHKSVHIADIPNPSENNFDDVMNMVNENSQNVQVPEAAQAEINIEEPVVPQDEGFTEVNVQTEETTKLDEIDEEKIEQAKEIFKKPAGDIKVFCYHKDSQGERFNYTIKFDSLTKEDVPVVFQKKDGTTQEAELKVYENCIYFSLAGDETMIIKDIPENTIFTVTQIKYDGIVTKSTRITREDLAKAAKKVANETGDEQDVVVEYFERTRKLIERNEIANASVKENNTDTYLFVNKKPGEEPEKKRFSFFK